MGGALDGAMDKDGMDKDGMDKDGMEGAQIKDGVAGPEEDPRHELDTNALDTNADADTNVAPSPASGTAVTHDPPHTDGIIELDAVDTQRDASLAAASVIVMEATGAAEATEATEAAPRDGPGMELPLALVPEPDVVSAAPRVAEPVAEPVIALVPVAPAPPAKRGKPVPRPFAWPATLLLAVAGLVTVAAAALLGLALTQDDWGSGARAAGLASLALGGLCLLVLGMRSLVWRRRVAWTALAAVVICGLLGGSALAATNPLRLAQGRQLEAAHNWPGALRAYLLAGETGSGSDDPARVYIEWGDALAAQAQYTAAVDRYEQAISRYPGAHHELQRAIAALWPAYTAWLTLPSASLPYLTMIQRLHGYQHSDWCASVCHASASALEAQTRFAYGQELAAERQYAQAVTYLQSVAATDPTSPYVSRAHATAATAYYALGQSERRGPNCATALPTYQTLASTYHDTPEGKQAAAALAAPVQVSGKLSGYPTYPAPTMYLSIKVFSVSHFSDDYSAALDASGGFTFNQVKPGAYNLSAAFGDGSGRYWQDTNTNNPYAVAVGPLCALKLGTFSW